MLFPIGLRLTKGISITCVLSLLMMSAPQPTGAIIVHRPVLAVAGQTAIPQQNGQHTMQQVLNVAVWRTDHAFVSTMHIKNSLTTGPITISPILYSEDGEEYDLSSITIPAAGITSVVVNQALDSMSMQQRSRFGNLGSAAIKYTLNGAGGINASMQVLDKSASLSYSFPFFNYMPMSGGPMPMSGPMPMPGSSPMPEPMQQVSEALWWKHDPGVEGHVALANSGASSITASVQLTGAKGSKTHVKSVTLQAYASSVVDLAEFETDLPGSERERGGITVSYMASSTQIAMAGWLENAAEGYSAKTPFVEKMSEETNSTSTTPTSHTLAGVGIMYGQQVAGMGFPQGTKFEPYAEVRNTTSRQIQVSMTVLPGNGGVGTEKSLGEMVLNAFETKHLDAALIHKALPNASGNINLTFSYTGMSGDLLFATGAVDQTGNYVFEVPIGGVGSSRGREVNYWSVKDGDDTMVSLWNPTSAAETLNVTLSYSETNGQSSQYVIGVPLGPRAAANISLMELIMSGRPDAKGKVIPRTITEGSLVISAASGRHDKATYVASVGTFNAAAATCWPNCTQCIGVCYIDASPNSWSIYVGQYGGGDATVYAYWYDGSVDDITNDVQWDGPTSQGVLDSNFNGIGGGSTDIYAVYEAPYTSCLECEESANCLGQYYYGYATVTVSDPTPNITGISSLQAGTPNILTITGSGFGTNQPGINITDPAGAIFQNYYVTYYSDTQIQVHVDVAGTAPSEDASVTVTSSGYTTQCSSSCFQSSQGNSSHSTASPPVKPANVGLGINTYVLTNGTIQLQVTDPNGVPVPLSISYSGAGRATFAQGAVNTTVNSGSPVTIYGTTTSSTKNDVNLKATDPYGNQYTLLSFSVISVTLALRAALGTNDKQLSLTDSLGPQYTGYIGSTNLGVMAGKLGPNGINNMCVAGTELVGTVSPSNFAGLLLITRTLTTQGCWQGNSSVSCQNPAPPFDDTGINYTNDPQEQSPNGPANGNVYNFDTPAISFNGNGVPPAPIRIRDNWTAVVVDGVDKTTPLSQSLNYFVRLSCLQNSGGIATLQYDASQNDNQIGTGSTNTSYDLQH